MRPELQWARDATVEALTKNPTLVAWAFEYTPPSSEAADMSYLSKVLEADFVVWLVGEKTTLPVRNEIAEALASSRRIWAITLPTDERDALTTQLLADVRGRAKTAAAQTPDELRELLALTFSDEIIRALRETPGLTRLALLEQLGRRSRARMVSRWIALGLDTAEAIAFSDDPSVGAPPAGVLPDQERPLSIVVGDVGAGKTVTAERALQLALGEARRRAGAPIPIFLHFRDTTGGLEAAMRAQAEGLGDPRVQGAYVVVDGADEVATDIGARVIEEARELAASVPQSRILITSRPTAALRRGVPERVELPRLSNEQARALIGRVAHYEITVGAESGWPRSVRDAVRRPLFAILMGLNRREGRVEPQTTGGLLSSLVESVAESADADVLPVLRRLGRLVTDGGGPVDRAELGDAASRSAAGASRIVRDEQGRIDFALPLIGQWFAADALMAGDVAVADVVASTSRLDRWRYALAIALATGPRTFVDTTMAALVAAEPAFAAEIVDESFQRWGVSENAVQPDVPVVEVAAALRAAFETWTAATAPLADSLLPHDSAGKLSPLGVQVSGQYLTFGWYVGDVDIGDISELPAGANLLEPPADWNVRRSGVWRNERGWAWRWGLEVLRKDLESELAGLSLRTSDAALVDEAVWLVALEAAGRGGSFAYEPVPIATVEAGLADVDPSKPLIKLRDRYVHTDQVLSRGRELRENGITHVASPWPVPDMADNRTGTASWIWDPYSPEQQRRRIEAVYGAALHSYSSVVDTWFPRLKSRMRTAVTLPAVLHGRLAPATRTPSDLKPFQHMERPSMSWFLDPLPEGSVSEAEVVLRGDEDESLSRGSNDWSDRLRLRQQKLVALRPNAAGWISTVETSGGADVFHVAPLAPLVYGWLKDDLKRIKWQ